MPPRTVSQVVAVHRHFRQRDNDEGKVLKREVQKEQLLYGFSKIYFPLDPETPIEERVPDQGTEVRLRIRKALEQVRKYSVPAINITATNDRSNCVAGADIWVDSMPLARDVPISHLLWLEDYLTELRSFLMVLPVLKPEKRWIEASGRPGLYVTQEPEIEPRKLKAEAPLVLHQGTDKHPPQVKTIIKETPVGRYETTYFSGAITEERKQELLDRMHTLQAAVKDARERANRTETVEETEEGDAIFDYLFA